MAPPDLLDLGQLVLVSISVPVYAAFLFTIIRYRKKYPFDSSFFKLCLSLGVGDMEAILCQWILGKFTMFGWFWLDDLVRAHNGAVAKCTVFLSMHSSTLQFIGVALIACNRFTALVRFNRHQLIWSTKVIAGAIAFQWLAPFLAFTPLLWLDFTFNVNNTTGDVGVIEWTSSTAQAIYGAGLFLYLWTIIFITLSLYAISFWKVSKMFNDNKVHPLGPQASNNTVDRKEIKLSIVGLTVGVLMFIYGWILFRIITLGFKDKYWWAFYIRAWSVVNDVFSWSNPWMCIVMSVHVREHMFALFRCRKVTAPVKKATTDGGRSRARSKNTKQIVTKF